MTLPTSYLQYARRRYGTEHDRYDWVQTPSRMGRHRWPNGAKVALWVMVPLEWFPLDMPAAPFLPHGGLDGPYPDTWGYTHRDYGNRVGVYRIMGVLDRLRLRATAAVNSEVAVRYPALLKDVVARDWEVMGHGVHMGALHYSGVDEEIERQHVNSSLRILRQSSGQRVTGWLSPSNSQSWRTPELLVAEGVEYVSDWVNDDLPYEFRTERGSMWSLPHSFELTDAYAIHENGNSASEFADQIVKSFEVLEREVRDEGRQILSVCLHPWISGQPHRIRYIEKALSQICSQAGVWATTGQEIVTAAGGSFSNG